MSNRYFFLNLLNNCATLSHLTQLHAHLLLHGLQNDIAVATKLTHKLFHFNSARHARALFFTIPKPDIFLFNVLIKGLSHNNSPLSAISLFTHLRKNTHLYPDNFTYAFVISAATKFGDAKIGLLLHGKLIVDGFSSDLHIESALVDMYFKLSREDIAVKMFDKLPERDTILFNTTISGLVRACCYEDSIRIFRDMVSGDGPQLDATTVIAVLPAVAELQELGLGMGMQCLAIKLGFHSHTSLLTGLISLYSKCGNVEAARVLFTDICRKDLISCNAMLSGFTFNGDTESTVRLFREWLGSGEKG